jgi:hypothetical protein
VRTQAVILAYHGESAVLAIPHLLKGTQAGIIDEIADAIAHCARIGNAAPAEEAEHALRQVSELLHEAAGREKSSRKSAPGKRAAAAQKKNADIAASAAPGSATAGRARLAQGSSKSSAGKAATAKATGRANARGERK